MSPRHRTRLLATLMSCITLGFFIGLLVGRRGH